MILVQFYEPEIVKCIQCIKSIIWKYTSYLPYLWYATFTNGQNGNTVRIIDNFRVKFWEKTKFTHWAKDKKRNRSHSLWIIRNKTITFFFDQNQL